MTLTERDLAVITAAPIIANTDELTRAEWLTLRRSGLGGSDAAAVLGLSKWTSSYGLWLDKTGQAPDDDNSTLAQRRGTYLEEFILNEATAQDPDLHIDRAPYMLRHPDVPIMFANVDGLAVHTKRRGRGGAEAKNVHPFQVRDWPEGPPPYYEVQVLHYMAVLGLTWWVVVADCGGDDLRVHYVERDEDVIEALVAAEQQWWQRHVIEGIEPAVDGSKAATEVLALIEARAGAVKVLDPDEQAEVEDLFRQLAHDQEVVKEATSGVDLTKNTIRQMLGEATELEDTDGTRWATWRQQKDKTTTDWQAAARSAALGLGVPLDELAAPHTTTSPGPRVLRVDGGIKHITKENAA